MLERSSAQPLYVQVRNILLARLENEEYKTDEKIPSESELCREFGISRVTLRSVLTELVHDGKLYRVQGKGTFVAEPKMTANTSSYIGVREQLEKQGYDVATVVLAMEVIACPLSVARKMNLDEGTLVYHLQRLRKAKGVPLSIHNSYIPVSCCKNFENNDFCNEQLCKILSTKYGLSRSRVHETLESVLARDNEAELLNIHKGYPLLRLCDVIADKNGMIFEYSTVVFRGDKMQIELNYEQ